MCKGKGDWSKDYVTFNTFFSTKSLNFYFFFPFTFSSLSLSLPASGERKVAREKMREKKKGKDKSCEGIREKSVRRLVIEKESDE